MLSSSNESYTSDLRILPEWNCEEGLNWILDLRNSPRVKLWDGTEWGVESTLIFIVIFLDKENCWCGSVQEMDIVDKGSLYTMNGADHQLAR